MTNECKQHIPSTQYILALAKELLVFLLKESNLWKFKEQGQAEQYQAQQNWIELCFVYWTGVGLVKIKSTLSL